jgi:hypothetical protein
MISAKKLLCQLLVIVGIINFTPLVYATPLKLVVSKTVAAKWSYTRKLIIDNQSDMLANAVVKIQLTANNFDYAKTAAGGADIRFTSKSGSFNGGGLSYWIEEWNNANASTVWVKIPNLAKGKTTVYLHYGNAEAKTESNGDATFLFFDDFESGDYTKKWTNVSIGEVQEKAGLLQLKESDGQMGIITANFDLSGKMIIRTLYQRGGADQHWTAAGIGGWNHFFCFGDHTEVAGTGTNWLMFYNWDSINKLDAAPIIKSANKQITDKFRPVAYWFDGKSVNGKQDDITVSLTVPEETSKLALRTLDHDAWDNFAHITVSPYGATDPIVTIGDEKKN